MTLMIADAELEQLRKNCELAEQDFKYAEKRYIDEALYRLKAAEEALNNHVTECLKLAGRAV